MSKICTHEAAEKDTAVHFDGLCPICLQARIAELREIAKKVAQTFPEKIPANQETVEFNVPAYIIEELRQTLKEKP